FTCLSNHLLLCSFPTRRSSDLKHAASDDAAVSADSTCGGFESPEGLRTLLIRLHESGPGSWHGDRDATELMRYTAIKYRRLARKDRKSTRLNSSHVSISYAVCS